MKDGAETTGYTIKTVSHALEDFGDIPVDTKKVFRKKVREMEYLTNMSAVSM